jgi:Restriction endonuclease
MARTVKEWIGKTPDTKIPPRVRQRIYDRAQGQCHICKLPIKAGESWQADHVIALINGGENRESNLAPAHAHCHLAKTKQDVAEKARTAAKRRKHIGIVDAPKMQGRPFPKTTKSARREKVAANKLPLPGPKPLYAKEARS